MTTTDLGEPARMGWICPQCRRSYSPATTSCPICPAPSQWPTPQPFVPIQPYVPYVGDTIPCNPWWLGGPYTTNFVAPTRQ